MNFAAPHIVVYEDVDDPISAADVAKQILSRAWLQYETVTIPADAEERRKTLSGIPLGRTPAIRFDGVPLCGLTVICRALAIRTGLHAGTVLEDNETDMMAEFVSEALSRLREDYYQRENKRNECAEFLNAELGPYLEGRFSESDTPQFAVGKQETWVDPLLRHFLLMYTEMCGPSDIEKFPRLWQYFNSNQDK